MTFIDTITQPGVGPIVGAAISAIVGLNSLLLKWLIGSFRDLRTEIKTQGETTIKWLSSHETLDQHRHEENLYRFEKVSVALARLGSENGTHDRKI
jgi:hypothetical protein